MAKRIPCAGKGGKCEEKASLTVQAFGNAGWTPQFYCDRCAGRIIRLRGKLVRKHKLNVVIRPITDRDRGLSKRVKKR